MTVPCRAVQCRGCRADAEFNSTVDDTAGHESSNGGAPVLTVGDSEVAVVGIGLCSGVIVASVAFVCYHRLTLRRLRAKQHTQTPAYRAMLATKHQHDQFAGARPAPGPPSAHLAKPPSPATKQRDVTPSSARRPAHNTASPLTSSRTASAAAAASAAAQLSLFQARPATGSDSPAARRSGRARSKSPRQVLECVCLVPGGGGIVEAESLALETRPPVEGRDSVRHGLQWRDVTRSVWSTCWTRRLRVSRTR